MTRGNLPRGLRDGVREPAARVPNHAEIPDLQKRHIRTEWRSEVRLKTCAQGSEMDDKRWCHRRDFVRGGWLASQSRRQAQKLRLRQPCKETRRWQRVSSKSRTCAPILSRTPSDARFIVWAVPGDPSTDLSSAHCPDLPPRKRLGNRNGDAGIDSLDMPLGAHTHTHRLCASGGCAWWESQRGIGKTFFETNTAKTPAWSTKRAQPIIDTSRERLRKAHQHGARSRRWGHLVLISNAGFMLFNASLQ